MAALENPRHERFAQELAKGKTANEAYAAAGYAPNDGNCIRLKGDERISARVAQLMEHMALRAEISVASVTEDLLRIARKAEELGEASALSVSRAAYMDAAKLNGLVVDKSESKNTIVRTHEDMLDDLERETTEEVVVARH